MLSQSETLQTFAEISATLAGFAALSGVVAERLDPRSHGEGFARLRLVVVIAILFLFLSMLPLVVFDYPVEETAGWRICSLVAFLMNAAAVYSSMQVGRRAGMPLLDRQFTWLIWPLEAVCQLALLANLFLIFPDLAGSLYLTYLLAGIAQAILSFLKLLDDAFGISGK